MIIEFGKWYSSYLTTWSATYFMLYIKSITPDYHTTSVFFLTHLVCIGGLYITYVHPRYIRTPFFGGRVLSGWPLRIADFVSHVCPHFIVATRQNMTALSYDASVGILLSCLYMTLFDPQKMYGISRKTCICLGVLSYVYTCAWAWIVNNN